MNNLFTGKPEFLLNYVSFQVIPLSYRRSLCAAARNLGCNREQEDWGRARDEEN